MEARFGRNERNMPIIIISPFGEKLRFGWFPWSLETLREVRACYRVILWRNLLFSFVLSSSAASFVSRLFYFDRALGEEEKVKEGTALYEAAAAAPGGTGRAEGTFKSKVAKWNEASACGSGEWVKRGGDF